MNVCELTLAVSHPPQVKNRYHRMRRMKDAKPIKTPMGTNGHLDVTPGFKEQSRVHLIHAPKKTTYIIIECIEINVTVKSEYLLHSGGLTKINDKYSRN